MEHQVGEISELLTYAENMSERETQTYARSVPNVRNGQLLSTTLGKHGTGLNIYLHQLNLL